jgi:hypothetical protein
MIDLFALGLTHALMALAAWRLLARADLDREGAAAETRRKSWKQPGDSEAGDA